MSCLPLFTYFGLELSIVSAFVAVANGEVKVEGQWLFSACFHHCQRRGSGCSLHLRRERESVWCGVCVCVCVLID